jgi:hypothetical protein
MVAFKPVALKEGIAVRRVDDVGELIRQQKSLTPKMENQAILCRFDSTPARGAITNPCAI